MNLQAAYQLVNEVASPSDAEGLSKERAILLLWVLRNVYGIDDLEAYEFICDGDDDQGIDGVYLESPDVDDDTDILLLFQSTYTQTPRNVGVSDVRSLIGSAEPFLQAEAVESLLEEGIQPELERLLRKFDVAAKLRTGKLQVRMVLVTSGKLTPQANRLIAQTNANRAYPFLRAFDLPTLAPIVEAFRSPATVSGRVDIACDKESRFVAHTANTRVAVCQVRAKDIIAWPGIDDRSLFDLNVRRELGKNQVRRALDRAISKPADHPNFLAFHNGLTVVCHSIDDSDPHKLTISDLSVVNGAQSTVAFRDNQDHLTDDLTVVVKLVEVPSDRQLAREVAIRSNTQNPVNARNLRARDGIQLRIVREFEEAFPSITYEVRPDASLPREGKVIQNDDAAQLLCAVYNQTPWVAIRRLSLFDAIRYPTVFTPEISAANVVLVDLIAERVQESKDRFPPEYLRSWRLTKLVAVYLVGQIMRTTEALQEVLTDPTRSLSNEQELSDLLDRLVRFAAATLKTRKDELEQAGEQDDFKVDFKREAALRELAKKARSSYLTYTTVEGE